MQSIESPQHVQSYSHKRYKPMNSAQLKRFVCRCVRDSVTCACVTPLPALFSKFSTVRNLILPSAACSAAHVSSTRCSLLLGSFTRHCTATGVAVETLVLLFIVSVRTHHTSDTVTHAPHCHTNYCHTKLFGIRCAVACTSTCSVNNSMPLFPYHSATLFEA